LRSPSALSRALKGLLAGSYEHDEALPPAPQAASLSAGGGADTGMHGGPSGYEKHIKVIHELVHNSFGTPTVASDLLLLAFYILQVCLLALRLET
jgi:hypothetical protein